MAEYTRRHAAWHDKPATDTPLLGADLDAFETALDKLLGKDTPAADEVGVWTPASGGLIYQKITNAQIDAAAAIAPSKFAGYPSDGTKALYGDGAWKRPGDNVLLPIDLRNPSMSTSPGNCFPTVTSLTAWEEWHWEFVKDVDGFLYGIVKVPASGTTAAKIVLSTAYNATSGVSRWNIGWASFADGASANPAALTLTTPQDITVPGTARLRKDVTFTLGSQPAANDMVIVSIAHNGAHANDTVAVNSELLGAWLVP